MPVDTLTPGALGLCAAAIAARLFVSGVLLSAAAHKLTNRLEFSGIVAQYRLVPRGTENLVAALTALLEIVAALCLLFAPLVGAALAAGLLLGYALAMGVNLQRGRRHIDCGCGGDSTPLSLSLVGRNLAMVGLLGCIGLPVTEAAIPAGTVAGSTPSLVLGSLFALGLGALYVCYNQLQVNAGIYRRLWLGENNR